MVCCMCGMLCVVGSVVGCVCGGGVVCYVGVGVVYCCDGLV